MNAGFCYRERVGSESQGRSVREHLLLRYPHSGAVDWDLRLAGGELELEGAPARGSERLVAGQTLSWNRPGWLEADVPLGFEVVHADPELLVVDKPSGLPTLPGGGFLEHTLLALVRARDPAWSPLHRLGRGTSGLVAFTRTKAAGAALSAALREGRIEKRYLGLARGALAAPQSIRVPIGPVPHPRLGTLHAASVGGKASQTEVERADPRGENSLAQMRILTGRPHQIRIHLAAAGHPLVGDPLYGPGGLPMTDALPGDGGYQLHAWRLGLPHPTSGDWLELEAPAPPGLS